MTTTLVIALWGAVIATGHVAWTIWGDVRDRGLLRINVLTGTSTTGERVDPYAEIEITNIGRRELRPMLVNVYVYFGHGRESRPLYYKAPHLDPIILVPEERWLVAATVKDAEVSMLRDVVVIDTANRKHRLGRLAARRARRVVAEQVRNQIDRVARSS